MNFFSPLEQFNFVQLLGFNLFGFNFSFANVLLPLVLILWFFYFFVEFFGKSFRLIPVFWQYFFEQIYKFILDIVEQQIGFLGFVYFPFIFTLFLFILLCNLISLLPFGIALTSHIIMVFFLSFTLSISVFLVGLTMNGLPFLKIFVPEAPFFLLFILIPIEIFSYFIRALSLAIRLSANIMAGHTLVFIISSFILVLGNLKFLFFLLFIVLFAILLLEFGVAFLQAYVFTILLCIYLNDSLRKVSH